MTRTNPPTRRSVLGFLGGAAALGAAPWLGACGSASINCWPALGFPPGIDWGPYVAMPTPTSMIVGWRSTERVVGRVEADARGDHPDGAVVVAGDESPRRRHVLKLEGLKPDARHAYRIHHGDAVVGGVHHFQTPSEAPEMQLRFAVVGDSGSGCPPEFDVVRVMRGMQPDLVLHVGDLVYNRPTEDRIRSRHFWPYADLIDHVPLYPTWGNHDVKGEGWQRMLDAFQCPKNDVDGTESFYAFQRGPCLFVVLNSANVDYGADSPQIAWLDRQLRADARWKIVAIHNPPYSSHVVPSAAAIRASVTPVLDRHAVDVVFSGDAHFYERTVPVRGGEARGAPAEIYDNPEGPIYVTSGGGGGRLYALGEQPLRAAGASVFHALQVDVDLAELRLVALDRYGRLFDRMRILKTG